jgi:hypothetical protein
MFSPKYLYYIVCASKMKIIDFTGPSSSLLIFICLFPNISQMHAPNIEYYDYEH